MVRFPETVENEWRVVAHAANAEHELRKRIEEGTRIEKEVANLRVRHQAKILFDQELNAEQTPTLVIGTVADYLANPASTPADLIEGVVKERGVCVLLGPSGAGKTTLALQMAHSAVTGADFLGQKVNQISGGVGLLSYDQDASISVNWVSKSGLPHDKASIVNANGMGNPLLVPKFRAQIAAAWKAMNVEVVIIDSFSASFVGMDQNDAGATMSYYRDMKQFALTEVGAKTLIVIVHSTDGSPLKPRGSTVHKDVADSMVVVTREAGNHRKVQMVKYREGLGQQEMAPVIIGAPDSVTHLVDVDLGAMSLANMALPAGRVAAAFTAIPDTHAAPTAQTDDSEEDDL